MHLSRTVITFKKWAWQTLISNRCDGVSLWMEVPPCHHPGPSTPGKKRHLPKSKFEISFAQKRVWDLICSKASLRSHLLKSKYEISVAQKQVWDHICSKASLRSHLLKSKFEITFAQVGDPLPRCLDGFAGAQPTRCHHHLCCRTHNCPGKFLWDCIVANLKPTNIHFDPGQRPGPARLPCLVPWPQPHTHFGKRTSYWLQAFFLDTLIL